MTELHFLFQGKIKPALKQACEGACTECARLAHHRWTMAKFLKKTALFEHQKTQTFTEEYSFTRPDGRRETIVVAPSRSGRSTIHCQVIGCWSGATKLIPRCKARAKAATKAKPANSYVYAARTGWLPQRKVCTQSELIGKYNLQILSA